MTSIIEIENLSKQFSEIKAVDDLSFSVEKKEVYGFLGQNGAGKSTTIRMMLTLIEPTRGSISIFGKNIQTHRREILQQVGAIIEKPNLYKYLTASQNLQIVAKMSGVNPTQNQLMEQLYKVGISERANSKVKSFSQGMKQRLGIACALINNPELIILDEPTNGLDPQGIADVRNLILQLSREEGRTIFVSSHLLSEIELVADSMLIIDKGRKVAQGKVADLLNPADTLVEVSTTDMETTKAVLQQTQWQIVHFIDKIVLKMHRKQVPHLVKFLVEKNIEVIAIQPKHSLEDYFLSLTTANQHVATYKN